MSLGGEDLHESGGGGSTRVWGEDLQEFGVRIYTSLGGGSTTVWGEDLQESGGRIYKSLGGGGEDLLASEHYLDPCSSCRTALWSLLPCGYHTSSSSSSSPSAFCS